MNEETLHALMVADTELAPPARIDLDRVVRDGRRRRRRRAVLLPSVAAAAVLVLVVGLAVAVRPLHGAGPVEPGATDTAAPDLGPAPAEFRLDRYAAVPTYFPYGLLEEPLVLSPRVQRRSWTSADRASELSVTVYAAGVPPWQVAPAVPGRSSMDAVAAPAVNGHPARWYRQDGTTRALAWRWATDAWAVVAGRLPGVDLPATLREVATNVRFTDERPIAVPFTTVTLPSPWRTSVMRVLGEQSIVGPGRFVSCSVDLTYGPDEGPPVVDATAGTLAPAVTITVSAAVPGPQYPQPNTMIAGHHAAVVSTSEHYSAVLYDVSGFRVDVEINGAVALALAPQVLVLGWAASVAAIPSGGNDLLVSNIPFR